MPIIQNIENAQSFAISIRREIIRDTQAQNLTARRLSYDDTIARLQLPAATNTGVSKAEGKWNFNSMSISGFPDVICLIAESPDYPKPLLDGEKGFALCGLFDRSFPEFGSTGKRGSIDIAVPLAYDDQKQIQQIRNIALACLRHVDCFPIDRLKAERQFKDPSPETVARLEKAFREYLPLNFQILHGQELDGENNWQLVRAPLRFNFRHCLDRRRDGQILIMKLAPSLEYTPLAREGRLELAARQIVGFLGAARDGRDPVEVDAHLQPLREILQADRTRDGADRAGLDRNPRDASPISGNDPARLESITI